MAETPPLHPTPLPPPLRDTFEGIDALSDEEFMARLDEIRATLSVRTTVYASRRLMRLRHPGQDVNQFREEALSWAKAGRPLALRRDHPEWPVVLLIAIILFTVAGLVLNLAGLFR